ncbi:transposase [Oscillibacter sp. 1-3]|uniref:transposase n=1 Tax=Oscillibacter sp. 1-3 TaxID=1235797 RepID=UPI001FA812D5|nr:transposase [Oscillibacter sp. 1-3]
MRAGQRPGGVIPETEGSGRDERRLRDVSGLPEIQAGAAGKGIHRGGPVRPAAKTCHVCECVNEQLSARARTWACPACGASLTRKVNTARNLREFGLKEIGALSAVS